MQSINKEAVRMLVQDIGYQKAAEQTGIAYATLRQWAVRGKWTDVVPKAWANGTVSQPVTESPAHLHAEAIRANGHETKLGLSEYAKRQAQHLATKGKLKDHGAFRNLASGSSTLHGWNENQGQTQFSLNVLNLGGSVQIGVRNTDHESPSDTLGTDQA